MLDQFHESIDHLLDKLSGWMDTIILTLPNLVLAALFLTASIFLSRRLKKVSKKLLHKFSANKTVVDLLSNLAVAVFILIALFVILSILNLSDAVAALLGTAGVAGLAVGLALQHPLVNLFSGVLMSVREYYKVGDWVETNGFFGIIQKISLRATVILTPDGQEIIIPNKEVLEKPLKNFTHNPQRRVDISCGVSYSDDLEKVKAVALKAIEESEIDRAPGFPVQIFFTEFGDSSINFTLRFWKSNSAQKDYLEARDAAIIALKKAFDQHGISIPFPIRTLELGTSKLQLEVPAITHSFANN